MKKPGILLPLGIFAIAVFSVYVAVVRFRRDSATIHLDPRARAYLAARSPDFLCAEATQKLLPYKQKAGDDFEFPDSLMVLAEWKPAESLELSRKDWKILHVLPNKMNQEEMDLVFSSLFKCTWYQGFKYFQFLAKLDATHLSKAQTTQVAGYLRANLDPRLSGDATCSIQFFQRISLIKTLGENLHPPLKLKNYSAEKVEALRVDLNSLIKKNARVSRADVNLQEEIAVLENSDRNYEKLALKLFAP
ncbi:MAG: hypothetical protein ABIR96_05390 [Bdellovibrionota bacterium]